MAIIQLGVGLLIRHATLPRFLTMSAARARSVMAAAVVLVIAAAAAAGVPHRLHHAWDDFKNPHSAISATATSRFGSASGEGRYQYWAAGVDSAKHHVLTGSGPGTFQLDWLPRARLDSYVVNAHSLYVETYAELGLVGLVLLVGFLVAALVAVIRLVVRTRYEERTRAAAIAAAMVAFLVSAAFDWVWQMPVIPVAILLLIAAALAPARSDGLSRGSATAPEGPQRRPGLPTQLIAVGVGLASLVAIAYPLATASAITNSQNAAAAGNTAVALSEAQSAVRVEPGSGAAQLQLALVLESAGAYKPGARAAERAVSDEPQNWANWLVLSRLEAEDGNAHGSLIAYRRARSLNPQSSLFRSS